MNPSLNIRGLNIIADPNVSDFKNVHRSLRDRLFSLPWRPFKKTNRIYWPRIYLINDAAIVSIQTFCKIEKEGKFLEGEIIGEASLVKDAIKALTGEK